MVSTNSPMFTRPSDPLDFAAARANNPATRAANVIQPINCASEKVLAGSVSASACSTEVTIRQRQKRFNRNIGRVRSVPK